MIRVFYRAFAAAFYVRNVHFPQPTILSRVDDGASLLAADRFR